MTCTPGNHYQQRANRRRATTPEKLARSHSGRPGGVTPGSEGRPRIDAVAELKKKITGRPRCGRGRRINGLERFLSLRVESGADVSTGGFSAWARDRHWEVARAERHAEPRWRTFFVENHSFGRMKNNIPMFHHFALANGVSS